MKRKPLTLAVAFVLLIVFGLMLFVYQVRPSEVAVVTRFGRLARVKSTPGPGFRLPSPIERVFKLDQRIQNFEAKGKFEEIKLHDQSIILLSVYVGYRINDPTNFFVKVADGSIPEAEKTLTEIVRSSKNAVAGRHVFSDFISATPGEMKFASIEKEILDDVQNRVHNATNNFGVEIKFVQIQKIGLPESVTAEVFDRMKSERVYYITNVTSQGELDATRIRAEADGQAAKLLYDAEAEAFKIRGEGEAEMMKSLQIMQENPELAAFNMQMDALEQFLKKKTTLVLDLSTSPLQWLKMEEPSKKDK